MGTDTYSDDSAYWQFRSLTALATANPDKYLPMLKATWDKEESKLYKQVSNMDMLLKDMYSQDKATAVEMASDFSYGQLQRTLSMATEIRYKMMTDLHQEHREKIQR